MSTTISLADAEAGLASLLSRVEGGAEFLIERDDRLVARLTPVQPTGRRSAAEVIASLRSKREAMWLHPVTLDELMEWRDEGRRF
jgi:antitoxin (DNA-binding transcriptional repressor) of toxin-antitoxin stability system